MGPGIHRLKCSFLALNGQPEHCCTASGEDKSCGPC